MKRENAWKWLLAASFLVILSACGGDDDDPMIPKAGVSFEKTEEEITESDGTPASFHPEAAAYVKLPGGTGRVFAVKIILDEALAEDAVVAYTLTGTASSENPANNGQVNDYSIAATGSNLTVGNGQITIAKGATEAAVNITVYEDLAFEYDETVVNANKVPYETIILTLTGVVSGPIELGTQLAYTLKIVEDDAVFAMNWGVDGTTGAGDADLDILFMVDDELVWGATKQGAAYEITNFPAGFPSVDYGVGYTYYGGSSNDVDFAVALWSTSGTLNGKTYLYGEVEPLAFEGHLGTGNINAWDDPSHSNHKGTPVVVQTFTKDKLNFSDITSITTLAADASSRKALRNFKEFATPGKIDNIFKFGTKQ